jgi:hypothetical protein
LLCCRPQVQREVETCERGLGGGAGGTVPLAYKKKAASN